jgi:hypothetical protein
MRYDDRGISLMRQPNSTPAANHPAEIDAPKARDPGAGYEFKGDVQIPKIRLNPTPGRILDFRAANDRQRGLMLCLTDQDTSSSIAEPGTADI